MLIVLTQAANAPAAITAADTDAADVDANAIAAIAAAVPDAHTYAYVLTDC